MDPRRGLRVTPKASLSLVKHTRLLSAIFCDTLVGIGAVLWTHKLIEMADGGQTSDVKVEMVISVPR